MSEKYKFRVRLKMLRKEYRLTRAELAKRVNVSAPMICQVERGTKAPSLQLAMEIADVLGCEVNELAG